MGSRFWVYKSWHLHRRRCWVKGAAGGSCCSSKKRLHGEGNKGGEKGKGRVIEKKKSTEGKKKGKAL